MRAYASSLLVLLAGCHIHDVYEDQPVPVAPTTVNSILPRAALSLPQGAFGYLITSNGQGDFILVWTDSANTAALFEGEVTNVSGFDSVTRYSGGESVQQVGQNQISFSSIPGAQNHGTQFRALSQPLSLYGRIDGRYSGVDIYFADSAGQLVVTSSPAAFSSP